MDKETRPVFQKDPAIGVYGPGHNSFVKSPDGKEDWIVYHGAKFSGAGWNRNVRMQKFDWNKDGTPNFGSPVPLEAFQRVPSGEPTGKLIPALPGVTYQYEAEQATVNLASIHSNTSISGGKKVGHIDFEDSYIEFNVQVPKGEYTLKVRYGNGMGQDSSHNVSVNGGDSQRAIYKAFGWDTWKNAEMDVTFTQEQNVIRLSKGKLYAEIDSIELVPKETTVFRYEAELANLKKAAVANDLLAANDQLVESNKNSILRFSLTAEKAGNYELKVRYSADAASSQRVATNSGLAGHVNYSNTNGDWQYTSIQVELKEGVNHINLAKGTASVEIDHITLTSNSLSD